MFSEYHNQISLGSVAYYGFLRDRSGAIDGVIPTFFNYLLFAQKNKEKIGDDFKLHIFSLVPLV